MWVFDDVACQSSIDINGIVLECSLGVHVGLKMPLQCTVPWSQNEAFWLRCSNARRR